MNDKLILCCMPIANDGLNSVSRRVLQSQMTHMRGKKGPRVDQQCLAQAWDEKEPAY